MKFTEIHLNLFNEANLQTKKLNSYERMLQLLRQEQIQLIGCALNYMHCKFAETIVFVDHEIQVNSATSAIPKIIEKHLKLSCINWVFSKSEKCRRKKNLTSTDIEFGFRVKIMEKNWLRGWWIQNVRIMWSLSTSITWTPENWS